MVVSVNLDEIFDPDLFGGIVYSQFFDIDNSEKLGNTFTSFEDLPKEFQVYFMNLDMDERNDIKFWRPRKRLYAASHNNDFIAYVDMAYVCCNDARWIIDWSFCNGQKTSKKWSNTIEDLFNDGEVNGD